MVNRQALREFLVRSFASTSQRLETRIASHCWSASRKKGESGTRRVVRLPRTRLRSRNSRVSPARSTSPSSARKSSERLAPVCAAKQNIGYREPCSACCCTWPRSSWISAMVRNRLCQDSLAFPPDSIRRRISARVINGGFSSTFG